MSETAPPVPLTRPLALLLAAACGVAAANIYYNQPLLPLFARDMGVTRAEIGLVPALVQIGYGIGLWALVPLGDQLDRKRLIVVSMLALTLVQIGTALCSGMFVLEAISLVTGVLASITQQIVALVAHLAAPERRGRAVGTVMTGLLLGILLSRTVGGALAEWLGWRATYVAAAAISLLTTILLARLLPTTPPGAKIPYGRLMGSLFGLLYQHSELRRSVLVQTCGYSAFSAFWSTMALMLEQPPYHMGSGIAGLFGLAAVAGALAAPLVGRTSDGSGSSGIVVVCMAIVIASFALMGLWQGSLVALVIGVVLMDLGVQGNSVANIARIHAIDPAARARLTAVLVGIQFSVGAVAAFAANRALIAFGWGGVCALGAGLGVIALLGELAYRRRDRRAAITAASQA